MRWGTHLIHPRGGTIILSEARGRRKERMAQRFVFVVLWDDRGGTRRGGENQDKGERRERGGKKGGEEQKNKIDALSF